MWVYYWALYSVPLIHMSVFVPIPHSFDFCSFVVLSEVWESYASCFVLFHRIALANLGLLWFHINFWIICCSWYRRTLYNGKRINTREDLTLINIYAPNIGKPKYIKQILTDIQGKIDENTIIVGDYNTPLTSMDRYSRQKNQ